MANSSVFAMPQAKQNQNTIVFLGTIRPLYLESHIYYRDTIWPINWGWTHGSI